MISKKAGRLLFAGAVAVGMVGTAMANTAIEASTTGDLFLNIEDNTTSTSYLFDTGVSQAAFNTGTSTSACDGAGTCSFGLAADANLTSFLAKVGGSDTVTFSVASATQNINSDGVIDVTGVTAPTKFTLNGVDIAQTAIASFLQVADNVTIASGTSVDLSSPNDWANTLKTGTVTEGIVSNRIFNNANAPYSDSASLSSALAFYSIAPSGSASNPSTTTDSASAFAGNWTFNSTTDTLSYSAVPLPTPVLLLLSGLGLMGAVSRRTKAAA